MKAVLLVDAAPGFEDAVEASLMRLPGVRSVRAHRMLRFKMAAHVEAEGPAEIKRLIVNHVRLISGVRGLGVARDPAKF